MNYEAWKSLPNFDHKYLISSNGVVETAGCTPVPARMNERGQLVVDLFWRNASLSHPWLVDRLVLSAFARPKPHFATARHKDEDQANCRWDNLEWVIPRISVRSRNKTRRAKSKP